MKQSLKLGNLHISFISAGMGSIDYCVTLCGSFGTNPSIRLKVDSDKRTIGKYCDPKNSEITPEKVKEIHNALLDLERADFLEWCKKNDTDPNEYPAPCHLENVSTY